MNIIATEIELSDNVLNDNTFTIKCERNQGKDRFIFTAVEECENPRIFLYEMIEDFDTLKHNSIARYDILRYSLGKFTPDDEVTLKDVFMQGEYIKRFAN